MITVDELVQREVAYCVSSLVHTLACNAAIDGSGSRELSELCDQASELSAPIDDWEDAASEEGWREVEVTQPGGERFYLSYDFSNHPTAQTWQELCESENIEPYEREVYEHWVVTDWFADKLAEKGEKVDKDFAGLAVWARTTTGQAISMDSVIQDIHAELVAR